MLSHTVHTITIGDLNMQMEIAEMKKGKRNYSAQNPAVLRRQVAAI